VTRVLEHDKIYNQDCFIASSQLPDQSVDVTLTDPPYPNRLNLFPETLVDGLAMLYLACKKTKKYVVFFWNPFDVPTPPPGWHEVARHVWHKPDTKSITHYEVIVVWCREIKQRVSRVWSIPILDYRSLRDWKPHPTQKPVRLIRYLLEQYTNEEDLVLDPFIGSGTTAVACKYMKRHYLGFEIDPKYCQIAQDRLITKTWTKDGPIQKQLPVHPDDGLNEIPTDDGLDEIPEPTNDDGASVSEESRQRPVKKRSGSGRKRK
jgi:DNA modification methylase